jgi:hypothetical protein
MNPWAIVIIGLGIVMVIVGIKGSQGSLLSALKGKA